mmetsp:Transcript_28513/g.72163  ORF Transcript_28513/g.72163 Transcript_28513/m.72163 type:complete len:424 (-) Transcript_28513:374-1645(-)
MSAMQYPQHFQGYPQQFQPFPPQPMGYPSMPYPQTQMPFHVGPQLPPNVGSRTLWVGDMDEWMTEHWLHATFSMGGTVTEVKVIRQRPSGQHAGYGFVEFGSQFEAQHVLNTFNGMHIPQHPTGKVFRLNWASHGLSGGKGGASTMPHGEHGSPEYSLFVGDLAQDVSDYQLMMHFRQHYASVRNAKVVFDTATGMSKGYGFVKFGDEEEKDRAMREMNGTFISTRQVRCSQAQKKSDMVNNQKRNNPDMGARGVDDGGGASDPSNTTLFVGGLDHTVNEHMLHGAFSRFGPLVYVRVPPGKACGFVQFANRASSEAALQEMQGVQMNMCRLRVSWGRATKGRGSAGGGRSPGQDASGGSAEADSNTSAEGVVQEAGDDEGESHLQQVNDDEQEAYDPLSGGGRGRGFPPVGAVGAVGAYSPE